MIGTKYTPELLAALAKTPLMARLDVAVEKCVDRVSVLSESSGVCVGFTTYRTFDKSDIETGTFPFSAADKITSFYGGMDDADPWLAIVEPY